MLKLVSLPIGNIGDITKRAITAIESCEYVFAEDTRVFYSLMGRLEIDCSEKKVIAFHDHSQQDLTKYTDLIKENNCILVSDAGSPIVSDPAYPLIKECINLGLEIDTCPGVSSVITAIELSGLPPHPFSFNGFLPREKTKIINVIEALGNGTHVYFESPHRILKTLSYLKAIDFSGDIVLARELTKTYQEVVSINLKSFDESTPGFEVKGEFVFLVHKKESNISSSKILKLAQNVLDKKGRTKDLSKLLSEILDLDNKEVYQTLSKD